MKFAVGLLLLGLCIMNAQSIEHYYGDVSGGVELGKEHIKVIDEYDHPSYEFTYPKVICTRQDIFHKSNCFKTVLLIEEIQKNISKCFRKKKGFSNPGINLLCFQRNHRNTALLA